VALVVRYFRIIQPFAAVGQLHCGGQLAAAQQQGYYFTNVWKGQHLLQIDPLL